MPKFKPGDRVRFQPDIYFRGLGNCPGTIVPYPNSDWNMIEWDNETWSTEKPEWLELAEESE